MIQAFDQWLFLKINQGLNIPSLDAFFLFITDAHKNRWIAIGVVLTVLVGLIWKYKKNFWKGFLYVVLATSLADVICYRVIKANFDRERPFQSESFGPQVLKIGHAHGNSFPSNHSANSFAAATSLSYLFPHLSYILFFYATLVAYSRVYLGVHYPIDVFAGALIGFGLAFGVRRLFKKQFKSFTGLKD